MILRNLNLTNTDGSGASGTGEIEIPFLNDVKVNVEFSGLGINHNGRVYAGNVNAVIDHNYDPSQMTSSMAEEMNNFIQPWFIASSLATDNSNITKLKMNSFPVDFTKALEPKIHFSIQEQSQYSLKVKLFFSIESGHYIPQFLKNLSNILYSYFLYEHL